MNKEAMVAPQAQPTDTEAVVLGIVQGVLGRNSIGCDDDLFDHGATSLSFVRVLAEIHQRLGVMVHAPDLDAVTPRHLATHVAAAASRPAAETGA